MAGPSPLLTTALDIITMARKVAGVQGVGQTPNAEDTIDGFRLLNMLLAQWQAKRWLIFHLNDVAVPITDSRQYYTIGEGQDINVPRPDRIEAAFFRQVINGLNQPNFSDFDGSFNDDFTGQVQPSTSGSRDVDYPLKVLSSREDYNRIALKGMGTWPYVLFYDNAYPIGYIYLWPVPSPQTYGSFQFHITLKANLASFDTVQSQIAVPPMYQEAMVYNLAMRLCDIYSTEVSPSVAALAKSSLETIRGANTQIPQLIMPAGLNQGGRYNIYSDMQGPTY